MTIVGEAFVRIRPDDAGFSQEAEKGILGKVGGIATKAAGIFAAGFAVKQGFDFFGGIITQASDLGETLSKVGVVFGEQQSQVTAFAKQMADDFGLPKKAILDAAASIGLIGKASGLSQGDAAKMSTELARLAADASSFYNVPLPEALQAIQSGLVGEAEPMRRFGVLLNEQAVSAEAARLGLAEVNGEYTEGAKAQARASLIMSGMKDATGDLERTQGSLSNRMRELKGRLENFTTEVGTRAIPIVLKLLDAGESLGKGLAPLVAQVQSFFKALTSGFTEDEGTPVERFALMLRDTVFPIVVQVATFVRDNLQPILIALGVTFAVLLSPIGAIAGALIYAYTQFDGFRAVVDAVVSFLTGTVLPAIGAFVGFVSEQFANLTAFVRENWAGIQEAISHVIVVVQAIIEGFVATVQAVWQAWGDEILNIASIVWDQIRNVIDTAVGIISGIIQAGLALINGEWGAAWDAIKGILETAWNFIVETVTNAIGLAREVIEGGVSAIVGIVGDVPGQILGALGDVGGLLYNAGRSIINGLKDGIIDAVQGVYDFVSGIAGKIADLKGPIEKDKRLLIPAGVAIMRGLEQGIASQQRSLEERLRGITTTIAGVGNVGSLSAGAGASSGGSTALTISGPLVVVQGGVAPGQEGAIGAAVEQAVVRLVQNGTVGRAMSKRSQTYSTR